MKFTEEGSTRRKNSWYSDCRNFGIKEYLYKRKTEPRFTLFEYHRGNIHIINNFYGPFHTFEDCVEYAQQIKGQS